MRLFSAAPLHSIPTAQFQPQIDTFLNPTYSVISVWSVTPVTSLRRSTKTFSSIKSVSINWCVVWSWTIILTYIGMTFCDVTSLTMFSCEIMYWQTYIYCTSKRLLHYLVTEFLAALVWNLRYAQKY